MKTYQKNKFKFYIKKEKEQVLGCCNNIVKVNATNNEDAQWNIVEKPKEKGGGHNDVMKKGQCCKKRRSTL